MIYAIINQCIFLIRILFSMYAPPNIRLLLESFFYIAHLIHYKPLDFSIVIECLLRCHYLFRLITKYKIRKVVIAKQFSQNNFPVTPFSHFKNITYSFTAVLHKVLKVTAN